MRSDERLRKVLGVLVGARDLFRARVSATVQEVRGYLLTSSAARDGRTERLAAELGPLGVDRIDVEAFATLFADVPALNPMMVQTVEKALNTLSELAGREEELFVADVVPGGSLHDAIGRALAEIGRVFGATRIVELIRTGRYHYSQHVRSLGAFPFARWARSERRIVPPLVVQLEGADLHAGELAEFLDGALKIILVVRGEATPAPLVRLLTPNTFVAQTADIADVDRLLAWEGPGVVALVPESAARFVHDPAAGPELHDRLRVTHFPEAEPRRPLGGLSAAQQAEELRQLRALAAPPIVGSAPARAPSASEPADKLAAWLLSQADLSGLG